MTILAVWEKPEGRQGGIDEKGVRKYSRTFQVHSDSLIETPNVVSAACGIALYAPYPTDPGAICKNQTAEQQSDEPYLWICKFDYDSAPFEAKEGTGGSGSGPSSSNNNQASADTRPWVLKFGSRKTTKFPHEDQDGTPVVNSAGQPFDPPLETPCCYPTISITAFKSVLNFNKIAQFQDAINSNTWKGFGPKVLRCVEYSATSQYDNGQFFWQLDIVLEVNRDLWNPTMALDAGTVEFYSGEGGEQKLRQITDNFGQPVNASVPLDNAGHKLPAGGELVFREFNIYREEDFDDLI